jgi:hypothetical protein
MEQPYRDGAPITDQTAPKGPIEERWDTRRFNTRLVNPTNRRRLSVIIIGTGLAGASAAATLGEGGYHVKDFCYEDSPRRAHSIAAQGGINAAKNYRNDGDSIYRLFYDTIKAGTTARASPTSIDSPKSASKSSINAWHRACPSLASTAACWTTGPSAVCRSRAPSTRAVRPANS